MRLFVLPASMALTLLVASGTCAWLTVDDPRDTSARAIVSEANAPAPERSDVAPADAAGWQALGRTYATQGRHALAVAAFRNAARLRPDDAALLTEYAFSLAVISPRPGLDDPQRLVERALQLDPTSPQALSLAGTLALDHADYDAAARHWERLAQLEPPDSPTERAIHASIAQARHLAGAQPGRIELAHR